MTLEKSLCIDLFLRERNPIVHAIAGHDAVLSVEQREYKAIHLKPQIVLPSTVWEQELVTVI